MLTAVARRSSALSAARALHSSAPVASAAAADQVAQRGNVADLLAGNAAARNSVGACIAHVLTSG